MSTQRKPTQKKRKTCKFYEALCHHPYIPIHEGIPQKAVTLTNFLFRSICVYVHMFIVIFIVNGGIWTI